MGKKRKNAKDLQQKRYKSRKKTIFFKIPEQTNKIVRLDYYIIMNRPSYIPGTLPAPDTINERCNTEFASQQKKW